MSCQINKWTYLSIEKGIFHLMNFRFWGWITPASTEDNDLQKTSDNSVTARGVYECVFNVKQILIRLQPNTSWSQLILLHCRRSRRLLSSSSSSSKPLPYYKLVTTAEDLLSCCLNSCMEMSYFFLSLSSGAPKKITHGKSLQSMEDYSVVPLIPLIPDRPR